MSRSSATLPPPVRQLLAAAVCIAAAQLAVVAVEVYPFLSGLGQLGGWLVAACIVCTLLMAALVCLIISWMRRNRFVSQRWLRSVTMVAILLPLLNLVYFTWLPTAERLGQAASDGDTDVVARCLFWGIKADATYTQVAGFGGRGATRPPLERAARGGHGDVLVLLLDGGADINRNQSAALTAALKGGHADAVELLLDRGAVPDHAVDAALFPGFGKDTSQAEALRRLLHKRPDAVQGPGFLAMAAFHAPPDVARVIAGIEPTPGYGPVYELLRQLVRSMPTERAYRAASPPLCRPDGDHARLHALEHLQYRRQHRTFQVENLSGEVMLNLAVKFGDRALVAALLADGVPAEPPADKRRQLLTPLHRAIYLDRLDVARMLIAAGADLDRANQTFGRPLHLAVQSGSLAMLELLIAAGAPLEAPQDKPGSGTALFFAVYFDDLLRTRLLVQAGANPNATGWTGGSACELARSKRAVQGYMSSQCVSGANRGELQGLALPSDPE